MSTCMPSTNSTAMPGWLVLLDADDAVLADAVERLGDGATDPLVLLGRDRGDVGEQPRRRRSSARWRPGRRRRSSTASSIPRRSCIGLTPSASTRIPSRTSDWTSSVAVVVPSPVSSEVRSATSRTSWAPMLANWSESSISRAIDTPSLVIVGAPLSRSSTTLRPFGPSVTLTVSASTSTPTCSRRRASSLKWMILPMWVGSSRVRRRRRPGCPGPAGGPGQGRPSRR